ncbi:MAG: hypothetical protein EBT39_06180, partial [Sphingobacteriia bacterium]|nr:hypothetical protein [Candidatus Fonsibacter lacus]
TKIHKDFYYNNYKTAEYQLDTFILFIEKAHLLMKNDGNFGMIIPNIILANLFIPKIREYLLSNTAIKSIGLCNKVFENVNVDTIILSTHKGYIQHNQIHINQITESEKSFLRQVSQDNFKQNQGYTFSITVDETASKIIAKMQNNSVKLDDICDINRGLHAYRIGYGNPSQTQEMIKDRIYSSTKVKDETYKLELRGYNIDRYSLSIFPENEYISYGEWLAEPRQPKFFEGERILMRKVPGVKNLICSFTSENYIVDQSLYIAKINNDNFNALFILSALNSRLCTGIFKIYTTNLMIYSHKLKLDSLGNSQSHKSSPKNKSH